jgi:hypothetical protein
MGHTYGNNIWRNIRYKIKECICEIRARHMGTCRNNIIRNNLAKHMGTNGFIVEMTLPLLIIASSNQQELKNTKCLDDIFKPRTHNSHHVTPPPESVNTFLKSVGPNEDYIVS